MVAAYKMEQTIGSQILVTWLLFMLNNYTSLLSYCYIHLKIILTLLLWFDYHKYSFHIKFSTICNKFSQIYLRFMSCPYLKYAWKMHQNEYKQHYVWSSGSCLLEIDTWSNSWWNLKVREHCAQYWTIFMAMKNIACLPSKAIKKRVYIFFPFFFIDLFLFVFV